MAEIDLHLLLKYPLITCEIRNCRKYYQGVIQVGDKDIPVEVSEDLQGENRVCRPRFQLDEQIKREIAELTTPNIVGYFDGIAVLLNKRSTTRNMSEQYRLVLHEYCEFLKFHLNVKTCSLSPDLTRISVGTTDENGREHSLEIHVDLNESRDIFQPINMDLPPPFALGLSKKGPSLTEIYDQFLAALETLQNFFNIMDSFDEHCCIMDPAKPTRQQCTRRIWLDENLSLLLTIDPLNVNARPDLKFLGPERLVDHYRNKLNEKLEDWGEATDPIQGILNILELNEFPKKSTKGGGGILMDTGECSICFSMHLDGKLPEIICENKSCERFYHANCLYEWLTSVNSERIFTHIQGQCPNCLKSISCPLPD